MNEIKPVKSGKVNVDGVNLYYELYGQGDPLVLVAGTGISLRAMAHRSGAGVFQILPGADLRSSRSGPQR